MAESADTSPNSADMAENESNVSHYMPVLRDGPYEQSVMRELGGLRRFTEDGTLDLKPMLELTSTAGLGNLEAYRQAGGKVVVDVPEYLTQTKEPNGLTEDVDEMLEGRDPVEILNDYIDEIDIPVISGTLNSPYDYSELVERYRGVSEDFERVAVRPFIPSGGLSSSQISGLEELHQIIGNEDLVLLDYVESGNLSTSDPGRKNLIKAASIFSENERTILDAFNVYEGQNYNFGPAVARAAGVEGFGDFAVDQRFPPEDYPPMGAIETRSIRHYDFDEREIRKFQGEGFNGPGSAFDQLSSWDKWDPSHCEFCREAGSSSSEGMGTWKKIRMGHYIESVMEAEA
jgi:hypothetical protein